MIAELNLWAAQDALLAAMKELEILADANCQLGFPRDLLPDHVWIDGGARGSLTFELTGTQPSEETFRMSVFVFVQMADEYEAVRERLQTFADGVHAALCSQTYGAVVPAWSIPEYKLDAGTDGKRRQLALELIVECRCW